VAVSDSTRAAADPYVLPTTGDWFLGTRVQALADERPIRWLAPTRPAGVTWEARGAAELIAALQW